MKKTISICASMIIVLSLLVISCNQVSEETEKPIKIENTLISVGLLKDTVGVNLEELKIMYQAINAAIDEIGYPDAGYDIWINQNEEAENRFIHIGYWPDQEAYSTIHKDQRYIDSDSLYIGLFDHVELVQYDRFNKFISK